MKICHVTSVHPMHDGRIFEKECTSLASMGYKVYIVGIGKNGTKNDVEFVSAGTKKYGRLHRLLFVDKQVIDKAIELDCDVYHLHDPELLSYAVKLKRLGHKVVFDSHEDVPRQIFSKNWIPIFLRGIVSKVYEIREKRICKKLDNIVVATSKIGKAFEEYGISTVTIHNYPLKNDNVIKMDYKSNGTIVFAGGLLESNGIMQLIDVANEISDVHLKLAGKFEPIVESYFNVNKNDRIEYLGYLSKDEVDKLYRNSTLGIVVDLPTGNNIDGLPIKLFEYMNYGLPIVTSRFPLRERIFSEFKCGELVDPYNKEEYKNAIIKLLRNQDYRKQCSENGLRAVKEKYNWAVEEKKLLDMYKELKND